MERVQSMHNHRSCLESERRACSPATLACLIHPSMDLRSGFCVKTRTFHSLCLLIPLPSEDDVPVSFLSFAWPRLPSLLPAHSAFVDASTGAVSHSLRSSPASAPSPPGYATRRSMSQRATSGSGGQESVRHSARLAVVPVVLSRPRRTGDRSCLVASARVGGALLTPSDLASRRRSLDGGLLSRLCPEETLERP